MAVTPAPSVVDRRPCSASVAQGLVPEEAASLVDIAMEELIHYGKIVS
jgi:hypothetical protein